MLFHCGYVYRIPAIYEKIVTAVRRKKEIYLEKVVPLKKPLPRFTETGANFLFTVYLFNCSTIALLNAGKSSGVRLDTNPESSTTTSLSI